MTGMACCLFFVYISLEDCSRCLLFFLLIILPRILLNLSHAPTTHPNSISFPFRVSMSHAPIDNHTHSRYSYLHTRTPVTRQLSSVSIYKSETRRAPRHTHHALTHSSYFYTTVIIFLNIFYIVVPCNKRSIIRSSQQLHFLQF